MSARTMVHKLPSPSLGLPIQINTHNYKESTKTSRREGEVAIPSSIKLLYPKALFFVCADQYLLPGSNGKTTY